MKTITDIKPQAKTPTRCNIYLDNVFFCGLELETVMKARLKIGLAVSEERLEEIQYEEERIKALDKALSYITRSKKTEKEVSDYLRKKGYTDKTINETIEKLKGYKFVDDELYATDYANSLSKSKGKRLIALELRRKGVSDADMKDALDGIEDESKSALAVAEKYMRNKPRDRQNTLKCYKYLLSKGFGYDCAKEAAEKAGAAAEEEYI